MTLLAALPLLLAPGELPSVQQAKDALLYAWSCRDEDGFTLCDPGQQPRDVEFTRFQCRPEAPSRGERVRAVCDFEGRLQRFGRLRGTEWESYWAPLPRLTATFWVDDAPGVAIWHTQD